MPDRKVKCMRCGEVLKLTPEQVKEIGEQSNKHNWNSNKWLHYSSLIISSKCVTKKRTEFPVHEIAIFDIEDAKLISEIISNYSRASIHEKELISEEENLSKDIKELEEKIQYKQRQIEQCKIEKEEIDKELINTKERFKEELGTENIGTWL